MTQTPAESICLDRLRAICLALPEVSERMSHGEPTWFIQGKKSFVMFSDHHHGGRFSFWCAAAPGAQRVVVSASPEQFYVPPYVGHRGWIGVYLDVPVDWSELEQLVADAYAAVAPSRLRLRAPARAD